MIHTDDDITALAKNKIYIRKLESVAWKVINKQSR